MTITVDRRIAELLCSRICHELVAGIAAINNGVELISEIDPTMFDEAMGLIGSSAKQASARVQYYRMAYGYAGHDALGGISAVTDLIQGLFENEERFELQVAEARRRGRKACIGYRSLAASRCCCAGRANCKSMIGWKIGCRGSPAWACPGK